jgi:thioredoxin 1
VRVQGVHSMSLKLVTGDEWELTVLGADGPVFVQFWRASCAVCKSMERQLDVLAAEFADAVPFFRVDCDAEADLVWAYEVMGTPTFIVFCRGEAVSRAYGDTSLVELRELVIDATERCERD